MSSVRVASLPPAARDVASSRNRSWAGSRRPVPVALVYLAHMKSRTSLKGRRISPASVVVSTFRMVSRSADAVGDNANAT